MHHVVPLTVLGMLLTGTAVGSAQSVVRDPADSVRVAALPLVELPAPGEGRTLALLMSGDGNWAGTMKELAAPLVAQGIAVVGFKSADYLHVLRTPEELAADVAALLRDYLGRWRRDSIVVVGYSRGADLAPFVVRRLPPALRDRIRLVALFAPSLEAGFRFHFMDLLHDVHRPTDRPILPELPGLSGLEVLCVHGLDERDSLCPAAPPGMMRVISHDGGHRIGDGAWLAGLVTEALARPRGPAAASVGGT